MVKPIDKLIQSREQGDCMDIPMREAAKQLCAENKALKETIDMAITLIDEGDENTARLALEQTLKEK